MNKFSVNKLKQIFPRIYATKRLILERSSYLYVSGWFESLKRGYPCKPNGKELPWMNYAVISFLENRLDKSMSLFEYGSGYSTIFYSGLVDNVIAIEHNPDWIEVIKDKLPTNAKVVFREKKVNSEYSRAALMTDQKFDVIVIDGFDRVNCMKQALPSLKEDGVLILDDSRRTSYNEGVNFVKSQGYKSLDFEGMKPTGIGLDKTTIFYREKNCFRI